MIFAPGKSPQRTAKSSAALDPVRGLGPIFRKITRCGNELTKTEKLVLQNLLGRLGKNGAVWPAQQTIAQDTGYSTRTVIRTIARLEERGWVTRRRLGQGKPNHYDLDLPAMLAWAANVTSRSDTGSPLGVTPVSPKGMQDEGLQEKETTTTTPSARADDLKEYLIPSVEEDIPVPASPLSWGSRDLGPAYEEWQQRKLDRHPGGETFEERRQARLLRLQPGGRSSIVSPRAKNQVNCDLLPPLAAQAERVKVHIGSLIDRMVAMTDGELSPIDAERHVRELLERMSVAGFSARDVVGEMSGWLARLRVRLDMHGEDEPEKPFNRAGYVVRALDTFGPTDMRTETTAQAL